ncbi:hypothetical protein RDI58_026197 [Solanum bulbocastanum]|uniref:Uncharacterized protein n=1 Tax=Solanum bulbocastanum TaxID=147425 RepID=A0AAN8Y0X4_SOLBU
MWSSNINVGVS